MAKSDNLRKAKAKKNDEFYTRLADIETEISEHDDYVRQFEGKTVLCNCDDPEWSNFFVFFKNHFKQLKIKKLITTHYNADGSPSYKIEWWGEMLHDDLLNLIKTPLKGDGDFRSDECIELLKEADIVVTNPPFSLYREYVALLEEYKKEWIIIGNKNAVAYKEFFPLLKDGKAFVGYNAGKGTMHFATKHTETGIGEVTHSVPAYWFTNLDLDKSHEPLILTKNYYGNEARYPKYDNYDAIECGKVKDIPKDYFPCWYKCPHAGMCQYAKTEGKEDKALCEQACNGEIGVPITYMANHCQEQFEIIDDDASLANAVNLGNGKSGNGRFYLSDAKSFVKSNDFINDESSDTITQHNTTQHNTTQHNTKIIQSTHHSQNAVSVTESLEYQSHSLPDSVPSSLELSDCLEMESLEKKSESENQNRNIRQKTSLLDGERVTSLTQTVSLTNHTTESSFKDCKKCNGIVGVPITFLACLCQKQFKVVGGSICDETPCFIEKEYKKLGYKFLKKDGTESASGALRDKRSPKLPYKNSGDYSISPAGEKLSAVYVRIFIQRKSIQEEKQ